MRPGSQGRLGGSVGRSEGICADVQAPFPLVSRPVVLGPGAVQPARSGVSEPPALMFQRAWLSTHPHKVITTARGVKNFLRPKSLAAPYR